MIQISLDNRPLGKAFGGFRLGRIRRFDRSRTAEQPNSRTAEQPNSNVHRNH